MVFMLAGGALGFALFDTSPGFELCALIFGLGAGPTIDEFAMLVYLKDVYWVREGRASIDATVIVIAAMGLVLLGVRPFDVVTGSVVDDVASVIGAALVLGPVAICFAKQRLWHGAIGLFLFPLAYYGAVRIGKPSSPWARWRYGERRPGKQAKAQRRFRPDRRTERLKERFRDAVGGSTEDVFEAKVADRRAREAAAAESRRRAGRQLR